jgi:PhoH-like ATPase
VKQIILELDFKKNMAKVSTKKIFVLDTSVLLHDHHSIVKFEENDVVIPITVLEELDKFKVGNEIKNYEARECIRFIDKLSEKYTLNDWIPIKNGKRGRLRIQMKTLQRFSLMQKMIT